MARTAIVGGRLTKWQAAQKEKIGSPRPGRRKAESQPHRPGEPKDRPQKVWKAKPEGEHRDHREQKRRSGGEQKEIRESQSSRQREPMIRPQKAQKPSRMRWC